MFPSIHGSRIPRGEPEPEPEPEPEQPQDGSSGGGLQRTMSSRMRAWGSRASANVARAREAAAVAEERATDARRASSTLPSAALTESSLGGNDEEEDGEEQIAFAETRQRSGQVQETRTARGTVVGGKSLVARQEMSKSSAKIGSVHADAEIDVLELARTETGTLRAKVSWNAKDGEEQVGWATATTNTGKQILDIEGADGALAPVLEAEAQPDGAEPEPQPEPEPEPQEGGEPRRDLPDMDEDELTPPVEDDTFRKVFEGRSEFLDLAGPFWSKKRCPEGPLGRGWEGPRDFISEELLPMFEEVDSYDARYEYALVDDVRRTTMWLEIGHEDGSYSKLMVYACEPQKKKKRKMEASTHFELWRLLPRPPTSKKGQQENAKKFGKAIVQFCASALGRKVGNGECWTLGERALRKANAAPPDACTSLSASHPTRQGHLPPELTLLGAQIISATLSSPARRCQETSCSSHLAASVR